jgi:hypothetical protein
MVVECTSQVDDWSLSRLLLGRRRMERELSFLSRLMLVLKRVSPVSVFLHPVVSTDEIEFRDEIASKEKYINLLVNSQLPARVSRR